MHAGLLLGRTCIWGEGLREPRLCAKIVSLCRRAQYPRFSTNRHTCLQLPDVAFRGSALLGCRASCVRKRAAEKRCGKAFGKADLTWSRPRRRGTGKPTPVLPRASERASERFQFEIVDGSPCKLRHMCTVCTLQGGVYVHALTPRHYRVFTPELQWQSRCKRRISQGWSASVIISV